MSNPYGAQPPQDQPTPPNAQYYPSAYQPDANAAPLPPAPQAMPYSSPSGYVSDQQQTYGSYPGSSAAQPMPAPPTIYGAQPQGSPYLNPTPMPYGMPAQNFYPQTSAIAEPASKTGLIALIMASAALVFGVIFSIISGSAYGAVAMMNAGSYRSETATPEQNEAAGRAFLLGALQIVPTVVGIVAITLGFMSRKKAAYRAHGLWALIIGFVAPVICFIIWFITFAVTGVRH